MTLSNKKTKSGHSGENMTPRSRGFSLLALSLFLVGATSRSGLPASATPMAIAAGGDTCATAHPIPSVPFNDSGNTSMGATNQALILNATCAGGGQFTRPGPDLVYQFTVGTGSNLTFTLTPEASYDPTLYILGTCSSGSTCIQESDTGLEGAVETIGPRTFTPGTYYLYVDSIYTADEIPGSGAYALSVTGTLGTPNNTSFYTLTPCRVLDTRDTDDPLSSGVVRTFTITGRCMIPPTAKSVSVNVTVTKPTGPGHVTLYPGDSPSAPPTSTINFGPDQTRANNAIATLGANGKLSVISGQLAGNTVHFILDVNGYFQ